MANLTRSAKTLARRGQNDVGKVERIAVDAARRAMVRIRQAAIRSFLSHSEFNARAHVMNELAPVLVKASAVMHALGRRRSILLMKQALPKAHRDQRREVVKWPWSGIEPPIYMSLDLYSTVEKLVRKTLDVNVDLIQQQYGQEVGSILEAFADKAEAKIRKKVGDLILEGRPTKDAVEELRELLDDMGASGVSDTQLETVFRTQLQTSFNAGRWQEDQDPDIQEILWGYKYVTAGDDRVRESHAAWDGVTLPKDHEFWQTHWPPNGWNCRCQVIPVFDERKTIEPDEDFDPDEGFSGNPGALFGGFSRSVLSLEWNPNQPRDPDGTFAGDGVSELKSKRDALIQQRDRLKPMTPKRRKLNGEIAQVEKQIAHVEGGGQIEAPKVEAPKVEAPKVEPPVVQVEPVKSVSHDDVALAAKHERVVVTKGNVGKDRVDKARAETMRMEKEFPGLAPMFDEYTGATVTLHSGKSVEGRNKAAMGSFDFGSTHGDMDVAADAPDSTGRVRLGEFKVSTGMQDTMRHEMGHWAHSRLQKFGLTSKDWIETRDATDAAKVSKYAATKSKELFAEAFSAYTNANYGKTSARLPAKLEQFMSRLTGRTPPSLSRHDGSSVFSLEWDPNQPRDPDGKWAGGGYAAQATMPISKTPVATKSTLHAFHSSKSLEDKVSALKKHPAIKDTKLNPVQLKKVALLNDDEKKLVIPKSFTPEQANAVREAFGHDKPVQYVVASKALQSKMKDLGVASAHELWHGKSVTKTEKEIAIKEAKTPAEKSHAEKLTVAEAAPASFRPSAAYDDPKFAREKVENGATIKHKIEDGNIEQIEKDWKSKLDLPNTVDDYKVAAKLGVEHFKQVASWKGSAKVVRTAEASGLPAPLAKKFNAALDQCPKYEGVVYRGVEHISPGSEMYHALSTPGTIVELNASACSSRDIGVASKFGGNTCVMRVATKTAASIEHLDGHQHENEQVLRKGSRYRVVGVAHNVRIGNAYGSSKKMAVFIDLEEVFDTPATQKLTLSWSLELVQQRDESRDDRFVEDDPEEFMTVTWSEEELFGDEN